MEHLSPGGLLFAFLCLAAAIQIVTNKKEEQHWVQYHPDKEKLLNYFSKS